MTKDAYSEVLNYLRSNCRMSDWCQSILRATTAVQNSSNEQKNSYPRNNHFKQLLNTTETLSYVHRALIHSAYAKIAGDSTRRAAKSIIYIRSGQRATVQDFNILAAASSECLVTRLRSGSTCRIEWVRVQQRMGSRTNSLPFPIESFKWESLGSVKILRNHPPVNLHEKERKKKRNEGRRNL